MELTMTMIHMNEPKSAPIRPTSPLKIGMALSGSAG